MRLFRLLKNGSRILKQREKERMRMSNITNKVVVITGASSGGGGSTARLRAGNAGKVALGARRKDRIDALVRDINAKRGSAFSFKTDVTKRGDVEALVRGTVDKYGRIDAIGNNSGIMPIAPMAALKVEEWDRMIDVNIKGLLYGVSAVLPIMQKQKLGHIINIASVAGFKVFAPGSTVYSATHFALRALTEGFRMELKADNIRCTVISPAAVATDLPEITPEEPTTKNFRHFHI